MPPMQLDDDVGADDERLGVGREELARQVDVARRVDVAHGDADELERRTGPVGELVGRGAAAAPRPASRRLRLRAARRAGGGSRSFVASLGQYADAFPSVVSGARVAGEQIVDRLAAHDDARLCPRAAPRRAGGGRSCSCSRARSSRRRSPARRAGRRARRRRAGTRRRRRCRPTRSACRRPATSAGSASLVRDASRAENCAP